MNVPQVRLTSLAHGGGCGCKLAPSVLQQLLADQPAASRLPAAAGRHRDRRRRRGLAAGRRTPASSPPPTSSCRWSTIRFDFGRIAATNAISDVYAMGGKPIMALAILGMPVDKIATEMVREILKGGARGLRRRRHSGRGRPFDRLPGAGLRPRGDRHLPAGARAPQRRREGRRRADPDQAARRRHLFGGDQEGRAAARRLRRDDRHHDAAQPRSAPSSRRTRTCMPSPT